MAAEGETKPVVAEEAEKKAEQAPAATENATAEAKPAEEAKVEATEAAPAEEKKKPEPKPNVHKQDFEKDVIYLYQFSRTPLLPSLSPYCLKVETFLRLAGLKYEVSRFFSCFAFLNFFFIIINSVIFCMSV